MSRIHIARDRQPLGQFEPGEVAEGLRSGRFLPTDLAWREGMESWQPLATFADLPAAASESPPEIPAPSEVLSTSDVPAPSPGSGLESTGEFPWEQRKDLGFFTALFRTIFQSLGGPGALFARLPAAPSMVAAYLFYLLLAVVSFAIYSAEIVVMLNYLFDAIAANPELAADPETAEAVAMIQQVGVVGLAIWFGFLVLVVTPCLPFVFAGFYHVLLMLLEGAKGSFAVTFATTCYVFGATSPLAIVPCCGVPAMIIWGLVSSSLALAAAHRTDSWRTALAVTIPFVLCCGSYFGLNLVSAMTGISGAGMPQ